MPSEKNGKNIIKGLVIIYIIYHGGRGGRGGEVGLEDLGYVSQFSIILPLFALLATTDPPPFPLKSCDPPEILPPPGDE